MLKWTVLGLVRTLREVNYRSTGGSPWTLDIRLIPSYALGRAVHLTLLLEQTLRTFPRHIEIPRLGRRLVQPVRDTRARRGSRSSPCFDEDVQHLTACTIYSWKASAEAREV